MLYLTASLFFMYVICDKLVKKESRWYFIHSTVNLVILSNTYKDVYNTFTSNNPIEIKPSIDVNVLNSLITSLHVYHLLLYTNLRLDDYLHHIIMLLVFNLSILQVQGSYPGTLLFFMNGLPGFIDYSLLFLTKYNYITKKSEKHINTFLNVYIRSPGILLTLGNILYNVKEKNTMLFMNGFFIFFNSQYYTRDVCINYGKYINNNI